MTGLLASLLAPLQRRIALMVSRALVRAVDDEGTCQRLRVTLLRGEPPRDGVDHFQPYGFAAVPVASDGSDAPEGVFLSVGGDRAHGIVLAVGDRRYRLQGLAAGEVALHDDQGQQVHLTRAGIVVDGGANPVTITNTPLVTIESSLHVTGDVTADGEVSDLSGVAPSMSAMRAVYNAHMHPGAPGAPFTSM